MFNKALAFPNKLFFKRKNFPRNFLKISNITLNRKRYYKNIN